MDITLNINADLETVFLINGRLFEGGDVVYGENEVVYITALPLSALLLPYTVKMVGGYAKSNSELINCYCLEANRFYLNFLPRYAYVYSVAPAEKPAARDLTEKFFCAVREKKTEQARGCMTPELQSGIDDRSLLCFFDGFTDIVAKDRSRGLYYLINKESRGVIYNFVFKNGAIDNIIEL